MPPNNQNQFPVPEPPQQPAQPPTPPQENSSGQSNDSTPYDFFMNPQKPEKKGLFVGGSPMQKIVVFGGLLVVLLLVVGLIVAMASGGDKKPLALLSVAQTQQEIVRISSDGAKNTRSSQLQNFAVTTKVSVTSGQKAVLKELEKQGIKPKAKELNMAKDTKTDQAFAAAVAANTYDTTFASTMETELADYLGRLETAASAAKTRTELNILRQQIKDTELLQKQLLAR